MWQRKELKRRGKRQFLRNWAATVAVCFILAFTGAEFAGSADFIGQFDPSAMLPDDQVAIQAVSLSNWELLLEWLRIDPMDGTHPMWAAADQSLAPAFDTLTAPFSAFFALLERSRFAGWLDIALAALGIAGGLWFSIWVLSAVSVGARRFLLESRVRDNISIAAMFTPFQHGCWRNVAKGMFLRSLFLLLWACTIVGFPVKLYSYRMVPYILAENPQARPAETLRLSRQMMRGNKWRCFVLDLTFYLHWTFLPLLASTVLGTAIGLATGDVALCQSLAAAAAGLLSLLFVNGYRSATDAGLYAALRQAQLDAGTPLSALFVVPAFGETAPAGEKPRLPDADVRLPEDPVFHYAQRHKLDYNRHYGLRTLILLFFTFAFIGWVWEVALHIVTKGIRWWDYSGYFMNLNGRICLEGAVIFGLGCCAVVYFAGPLLGGLLDRLSPARQNTLCAVLLTLFVADLAYSHFHPNAGEGITDYNDWQQDAARDALLPEAANDSVTAILSE